jgi:large subunit ribosomal protein L32
MGLPGHRRTSGDKRRRASHFALKAVNFTNCAHCKVPVLPHQVCTNCGYYRGRQVLKPKIKLSGRAKARAAAVAEKSAKTEEKE